MATLDFDVDEFIFNESAMADVLREGTKMLMNDVKKNAKVMLSENKGYMNSGKYMNSRLISDMRMRIYKTKGYGKITFEGTQHPGWGKNPVRNNEVAFVNEYGAPGRSMNARPFMLKSCVELRSDEIEALEKLIK